MSTPRQDNQTPAGAATGEPSAAAEPPAAEIADAVSAVPGVAALSGGRLGGVGTYLPGRRVTGIVIRGEDIEVHVVGRYGVPVAEIAAGVRLAAGPLAGDRTVHVIIEDLA
ncbi:MAG TPA: hypothetical protein VE864_06895 [Streptosporangiaceae bacterium]|nr:hypothetical protein [Streptosporangiaceae bacterium]